jgi:hypothetical protein
MRFSSVKFATNISNLTENFTKFPILSQNWRKKRKQMPACMWPALKWSGHNDPWNYWRSVFYFVFGDELRKWLLFTCMHARREDHIHTRWQIAGINGCASVWRWTIMFPPAGRAHLHCCFPWIVGDSIYWSWLFNQVLITLIFVCTWKEIQRAKQSGIQTQCTWNPNTENLTWT